jgi:hypothetical protein
VAACEVRAQSPAYTDFQLSTGAAKRLCYLAAGGGFATAHDIGRGVVRPGVVRSSLQRTIETAALIRHPVLDNGWLQMANRVYRCATPANNGQWWVASLKPGPSGAAPTHTEIALA